MATLSLPRTGALVVALALLGGCTKAPSEQMDAARGAILSAEEAEADVYAPSELTAAREALQSATSELETQRSKLVFVRSYGNAASLAEQAVKLAQKAEEAAVLAFEQARDNAQAAHDAAIEALDSAEAAMQRLEACAGSRRSTNQERHLLREGLTALRAQLDNLQDALAEAQYKDAEMLSASLLDDTTQLVTDIEAALAEAGC